MKFNFKYLILLVFAALISILLNLPVLYGVLILILISIPMIINIIKNRKTKNINVEENNSNISKKYIFLMIYNLIIVTLILITDWSDWGAILIGPMVFIMELIINPILTGLMFRKDEKRDSIILKSFFISIGISILSFFVNYCLA